DLADGGPTLREQRQLAASVQQRLGEERVVEQAPCTSGEVVLGRSSGPLTLLGAALPASHTIAFLEVLGLGAPIAGQARPLGTPWHASRTKVDPSIAIRDKAAQRGMRTNLEVAPGRPGLHFSYRPGESEEGELDRRCLALGRRGGSGRRAGAALET